jgi:hypothetical protein
VLPICPNGPGPFPDYGLANSGDILMVNPCDYKGLPIFLELARAFPDLPFAAVPTWGTTSADRAALATAGWIAEGVAFYAAPPTAAAPPEQPEPPAPAPPEKPGTDDDSVFSIAVIPDTQQEVFSGTRFINRSNWLVEHAAADDLDLRFVTHTGDVVNWDTDDHSQYKMASAALKPLETAGIPYSLSIGNHDSQATGPGGDARDPKRTRILARDTSTFNDYFTAARYGDVSGAFEAGKVDNVWSEFSAAGASWIVLNIEMWPRTAAVDWAKQVVASHPTSNIIVVTHTYLTQGGGIAQGSGYGETSPHYLYDNLISKYENIKMVFSGHVGVAASRVDTGKNGNKIYSFVAAIHSSTTNPVRIVTIDTSADTIASKIIAPYDNSSAWRGYDKKITGVDWAG